MADKVLPSAFPHPVPGNCWGDPSCGMTLLDYFAGQALAAMNLKHDGFFTVEDEARKYPKLHAEWAAKAAYRLAAAMLNERQSHEG